MGRLTCATRRTYCNFPFHSDIRHIHNCIPRNHQARSLNGRACHMVTNVFFLKKIQCRIPTNFEKCSMAFGKTYGLAPARTSSPGLVRPRTPVYCVVQVWWRKLLDNLDWKDLMNSPFFVRHVSFQTRLMPDAKRCDFFKRPALPLSGTGGSIARWWELSKRCAAELCRRAEVMIPLLSGCSWRNMDPASDGLKQITV